MDYSYLINELIICSQFVSDLWDSYAYRWTQRNSCSEVQVSGILVLHLMMSYCCFLIIYFFLSKDNTRLFIGPFQLSYLIEQLFSSNLLYYVHVSMLTWTHCYRNISTLEKRKLGVSLSKLCPEDLRKALDIVAQNNLNFQATAEEVELDINAQVLIFIHALGPCLVSKISHN